jgi:hypothetical protein
MPAKAGIRLPARQVWVPAFAATSGSSATLAVAIAYLWGPSFVSRAIAFES